MNNTIRKYKRLSRDKVLGVSTTFSILIILFLVNGCGSYSPISSERSDNQAYDFEMNPIHPSFYIYHFSDDSTRIYSRIKAKELLYVRESVGSPFSSHVKVDVILKDINAREFSDSDTSTYYINSIAEKGRAIDVESEFSLNIPTGKDYSLELIFTDQNRNMYSVSEIFIYKKDQNTVQNYLLTNKETNKPLYDFISEKAIDLVVESKRTSPELLFLNRYTHEIGLPPPPFSDSNSSSFPLPESKPELMNNKDGNAFTAALIDGVYFISPDEVAEHGIAVTITDDSYPYVKTSEEMAKTVRYITSRVEYDNLNLGHDIKPKIDKFWIECAADEERAKDLIGMYYNRVEEANFYFTSTIPGWKTDRGLIHIVYGNPKKIYRFADRETWLYGEEDNLNSLSFNFVRQTDGFSNNQFVLSREQVYRNSWERAVTGWRNGRVFSD